MKSFVGICLLSLFALVAVAQTDREARLDSLFEDVFFSDEELLNMAKPKAMHFLYATASATNKTFYAGREIGESMPNATGQLMYFNSWGLYSSLAGYWYSDIEPNYSMTLATLGYSNPLKFHKNLSLRASYDHFFYNLSGSDFEPTYFGSLSAGASYRYKWLSGNFDAIRLLGGEAKYAYTASLAAKFTLYKKGKFKIKTRPSVSFYIASEEVAFYNENYVANDGYYYEEEMGLLNTQFTLPLSVNYKDFDFRVAYRFNTPRSLDELYEYEPSQAFTISVGYFFDLSKR